ncbi:hypothetical protein BACCIP111895_03410 [Neobacillus rhizosphaerae]|uniref:Uncharacterized protein n=1 Tax=Neobacillus rhizosphaerae TaxID=2880965 RepID=A0ABN8KUZ8_9BACI|nr:hypothetical protein BACCIP111895_03410 [Neobacillus rhizosphaerae]
MIISYKGDYSLSVAIEDRGEEPVIEIPELSASRRHLSTNGA